MFSITKKLFSSINRPNFPIKILEQAKNGANFIKVNNFQPHTKHFTIENLYGIHRDDVDLTIMYKEENQTHTIWKFVSSNYVPKTAYFVNGEGQIRLFDFTNPDEMRRFVKMDAIKK
jgi:hypothetical protein